MNIFIYTQYNTPDFFIYITLECNFISNSNDVKPHVRWHIQKFINVLNHFNHFWNIFSFLGI